MYKILDVILEILKVTLPALVVFATVYYLFKTFLENQQKMKMMEIQKEGRSTLLPLKFQAYERLALFCERISLGNLVTRLRQEDMSAADLRLALILGIQQEYEHNLSQQVYVSEDLWKMVTFGKNDTINVVDLVFKTVKDDDTGRDLSRAIFNYLNEVKITPVDKVRSAIAQEAAGYF